MNPFDAEAQKQAEEIIHKQNIDKNLQDALEFAPETLVAIEMLYIKCNINGKDIVALVGLTFILYFFFRYWGSSLYYFGKNC